MRTRGGQNPHLLDWSHPIAPCHAVLISTLLLPADTAPDPGIISVDIGRYQLLGTYPLPAGPASEASAVTYNWETDTLFVLGDEGDALVEVTKRGVPVSEMTMEGFDDTEGLTFIGRGRFVVVEERLQNVYELVYEAGGSIERADLPEVSIGPTIGNVGLEGATYEPETGRFVIVKEKSPQRVIEATIDFPAGRVTVGDLFDPDDLDVDDLSGIQTLATVPSLSGRPDGDHFLIYSQESQRLMEVTPEGERLGSFDFSGISSQAEGVTIDRDGVIYIVDETPNLHVLTPPCLPDLDDDAAVGMIDLELLLTAWDTPAGDLDGDGSTGIQDLLAMLSRWGACPSYEP